MQIIQVNSPQDLPALDQFGQVARAVYAADPLWVPQSEGLFLRLLAASSAPGAPRVAPLVCLVEGRPAARAVAILHPSAAPVGYIGFFEFTAGDESAALGVLARCEEILQSWGAQRIQAPRADNLLVGLLVKGFDLPQAVFTAHNPPYYQAALLRAGYCEVERLVTFRFTRQAVKPLSLALPALPKNGLTTRSFARSQLEREVQALNRLQTAIFQAHPGYVPRSLDEDRAMVQGFLPLLDDDLVIFAENAAGEPVGLLICLPDVYQAYQGQPVTAARLISIGSLPGWRFGGCGALMVAHLVKNLLAKGYQSLEASWIKENNHLPQNLARRFGGIPGREFVVFEKQLKLQGIRSPDH